MIAILTVVKWNLFAVLISITPVLSDTEHLFMGLLAICMSYLKKCSYRCSAHFFVGFLQQRFMLVRSIPSWKKSDEQPSRQKDLAPVNIRQNLQWPPWSWQWNFKNRVAMLAEVVATLGSMAWTLICQESQSLNAFANNLRSLLRSQESHCSLRRPGNWSRGKSAAMGPQSWKGQHFIHKAKIAILVVISGLCACWSHSQHLY